MLNAKLRLWIYCISRAIHITCTVQYNTIEIHVMCQKLFCLVLSLCHPFIPHPAGIARRRILPSSFTTVALSAPPMPTPHSSPRPPRSNLLLSFLLSPSSLASSRVVSRRLASARFQPIPFVYLQVPHRLSSSIVYSRLSSSRGRGY